MNNVRRLALWDHLGFLDLNHSSCEITVSGTG